MKIYTSKMNLNNFDIITAIKKKTISFTEINCYKGQQELIQSMLNGMPINSLYFLEDDKGNYSVLDGNWRISNAINYIESNMFLELSSREQRRLEDYLWDVIIILYSFDRKDVEINEIKNLLHFNWRK